MPQMLTRDPTSDGLLAFLYWSQHRWVSRQHSIHRTVPQTTQARSFLLLRWMSGYLNVFLKDSVRGSVFVCILCFPQGSDRACGGKKLQTLSKTEGLPIVDSSIKSIQTGLGRFRQVGTFC